MAAARGPAQGPRVRFTWGENDLPANANEAAYPKWVISPEDPRWKPFIEKHFNTRIFTPDEIAGCLKFLSVFVLDTKGVAYLSCITSAGHHSSTIMPSQFYVKQNNEEGKPIPSHVKSFFIIRGRNRLIPDIARWCNELNRISNGECKGQLAYAEFMQAIYDVLYKRDGDLGPQDWEQIMEIFNDAMNSGKVNFGTDLTPYIDQARELFKNNPTPEYRLSYISLVQLMTELYLEDNCFRPVQPDTYTVGSLSGVDFNDEEYVRTDGQATSDDIKRAAFNLIIMIEVDDGEHRYKIRMGIDRDKLKKLLIDKLVEEKKDPSSITRISYWVGQFIEFTTTHQFIEIVIKVLNDHAAAAATAAAEAAEAATAAKALEVVLELSKVSKEESKEESKKESKKELKLKLKKFNRELCINTAITSGCKGGDLIFYSPANDWAIIRPSFINSCGDIVMGYHPDGLMILYIKIKGRLVEYTHTKYTEHFILCNPFGIPSSNRTTSDRVHYYCILPHESLQDGVGRPTSYFFSDYVHKDVDKYIGTETGATLSSLTVEFDSITEPRSQPGSSPEASQEEERLKAEAEAKRKAEEERLKAEAEAKKAEEKEEEKRTGSGDELVTNAVKRGQQHIQDEEVEALSAPTGPISNSIFGSIINSFCSFFRSARVSFDTKPNKNVLIFRGQNIITKMIIMFVLEAAERYDRNVDIAAAKALAYAEVDADAVADAVADLVLCSKLAFDAAFQLKFLFPDGKLTFKDLTSDKLDNIAVLMLNSASIIAIESDAISHSPIGPAHGTISENKILKITILKNCANVATMAARIVAYCCALKFNSRPMDTATFGYTDKYFRTYFSNRNFSDNQYFNGGIKDDVLNEMKEKVKDATMELLNMGLARDHLFTTAIDRVEAIVASENSEAAKKELDLLRALPASESEKYLSNAEKRVQFTQNEVDFYRRRRSMAGAGKSRRKSRKNVKKNTRRNKKFRVSSKTKKQRRGYSRRRCSYSRKNNSRRRQ